MTTDKHAGPDAPCSAPPCRQAAVDPRRGRQRVLPRRLWRRQHRPDRRRGRRLAPDRLQSSWRQGEPVQGRRRATITERTNAGFFATLATFPDQPRDLEADLIAFAFRLNSNCICSRDGKFLRRLIQNEGERYPELFAGWREDGPGKTWAALAARFARLALAGHLDIDDPDLAAASSWRWSTPTCTSPRCSARRPTKQQLQRSAANAVRTFLRAYRRRPEPAVSPFP